MVGLLASAIHMEVKWKICWHLQRFKPWLREADSEKLLLLYGAWYKEIKAQIVARQVFLYPFKASYPDCTYCQGKEQAACSCHAVCSWVCSQHSAGNTPQKVSTLVGDLTFSKKRENPFGQHSLLWQTFCMPGSWESIVFPHVCLVMDQFPDAIRCA